MRTNAKKRSGTEGISSGAVALWGGVLLGSLFAGAACSCGAETEPWMSAREPLFAGRTHAPPGKAAVQADDLERGPAAASLIALESGFCVHDAGYPDCLALEIRGYEKWLSQHPRSRLRPAILIKLAETYLELAGRLEQPAPWHHSARAELLRGRALEIAELVLAETNDPESIRWAREFISAIKNSGAAYSSVPNFVLR